MKILDADIQWGGPYANQMPSLEVLVDKVDWDEMRFMERNGHYLSTDIVMRHYTKKDPSAPSEGLGGVHIKVTMVDGSERVLVGPWISGAYVFQQVYPEFWGLVDVTVYTNDSNIGLAGFVMALPNAKKVAKKFVGEHIKWVKDGFHGVYYPYLEEEGPKFYRNPEDDEKAAKGWFVEKVTETFSKNHPDFNLPKWSKR